MRLDYEEVHLSPFQVTIPSLDGLVPGLESPISMEMEIFSTNMTDLVKFQDARGTGTPLPSTPASPPPEKPLDYQLVEPFRGDARGQRVPVALIWFSSFSFGYGDSTERQYLEHVFAS